jgi:indolepyruvate ferredoxin oxidoreductase beta subunit
MSPRASAAAGAPEASAVAGNLVVAGVGGQGVILAGNLVAQVLLDAGCDVKKSEVHGMSQRGGTVVSHVRFGPEVHSVMVEPGSADWIVAFEWEEGLRCLPYLKPDGVALVSTERRIPPAAMLDHRALTLDYPSSGDVPPGVLALDTFAVAGDAAAAAPVIAQTTLIGALSVLLPFPEEAWEAAIRVWVPHKALAGNLTAFQRGRALAGEVRAAKASAAERAAAAAGPADPAGAARTSEGAGPAPDGAAGQLVPLVRIERSWCKGCDICIAVCPERCLVLDKLDVAVFAHPERCTGCQLCAWLCPDLAIDVLRVPAGRGRANEENYARTTADPR